MRAETTDEAASRSAPNIAGDRTTPDGPAFGGAIGIAAGV